MRPYDEVVQEIQSIWRDGLAKLEQALALAREQGFTADAYELSWAITHVEGKANTFLSARDPYDRLQSLLARLESGCLGDGQIPRDHETWILCPRAHAERHGFRIPRTRVPTSTGRELLRMVDRFSDGEDLVYAIAPTR